MKQWFQDLAFPFFPPAANGDSRSSQRENAVLGPAYRNRLICNLNVGTRESNLTQPSK